MNVSPVECPRCKRPVPGESRSDACPGCGHPVRRCAGCGGLLPSPPPERCPDPSCRARLLYLPLSGGQPVRVLHLYAELCHDSVPYRVEGLIRQPNDGTTLYRVSTTDERAFRKRYREAPARGPNGHALALKEMVLECRGAPAGSGTSAEEFGAVLAKVSALRHPGVVRTYAGWQENGRRYILMQALQGDNVRDVFLRAERPGNGAPARVLRQTARSLAEAVEAIHRQGILHRDITPTNVVWEEGRPVIIDFGNAVLSGPSGSGRAPLTHRYAPLEMYGDAGLPVDARADQYLLGSLLFCMAWGVPADFYLKWAGLHAVALAPDRRRALQRGSADPQRPVAFYRPDLPAAFAAAVDRMMALRPEDRFPDDTSMRRALSARRTLPLAPGSSWRARLAVAAALLGSGWLGVEVSPGVRAEWHLRQAAGLAAEGRISEARALRDQALTEARGGTPMIWAGRVAAARVAYGRACLDAGWLALNRGDSRQAARLATEALTMLGWGNSASAKELLRRSRTLSPEE